MILPVSTLLLETGAFSTQINHAGGLVYKKTKWLSRLANNSITKFQSNQGHSFIFAGTFLFAAMQEKAGASAKHAPKEGYVRPCPHQTICIANYYCKTPETQRLESQRAVISVCCVGLYVASLSMKLHRGLRGAV
jgi:hypothetical protein